MASIIFKAEPNLVKLKEPICVVGDIHGQYFDLLNLLNKNRPDSDLNFLFMGDYVDRGIYGLQTCFLLLALKISFPKKFMLLRGNHESRSMTE